jgi:hypothetical protein
MKMSNLVRGAWGQNGDALHVMRRLNEFGDLNIAWKRKLAYIKSVVSTI